MEKLEEMTGIATINEAPSIVFLNFGAKTQSIVGNTKDLRTDYSDIKSSCTLTILNFMKMAGGFSKRVENLWEKDKLCCKNKSPFCTVLSNIFVL